jgi:hypothetical protein
MSFIYFKTIAAGNGNRLMHLGLMLIKVNGIGAASFIRLFL